jgi:4-hydroxy-4-methyl-2-oxoglutarate aldolase
MSGDLRQRLAQLATAALVDAAPEVTWAGPAVRPLWRPSSFAAPAFTVQSRAGDNRPLHHAIAEAPPGHAVVVAAERGVDVAVFGDLLSRIATERGIAALVTDGAVRDSDGIRALGFPVFCGGVSLRAPVKEFAGIFGVPVRVGDAEVRPGDWVVGDSDGVVVIPAGEAAAAAAAAEAVERREQEIVRRARAGESTPRQLGLE